nr:hypothetical protein [Mycolicibacterium baixiangningiae]
MDWAVLFPECVEQERLSVSDEFDRSLRGLNDLDRQGIGPVPVRALVQPQSGQRAPTIYLHAHRPVGIADSDRKRVDLFVERHREVALSDEAFVHVIRIIVGSVRHVPIGPAPTDISGLS